MTTDATSAAIEAFLASETAGGVVLEGFHAVKHALRFGVAPEALLTSDPDALSDLAEALAPDVAPAVRAATPVTAGALASLVPRLASPCLGVVRRPTPTPVDAWDAAAPLVVLERPRHAGNLGAVVRVAAAAGAAGVAVVDGPSPWGRAVARASAGLVLAVPVASHPDLGALRADLDAARRPLVALDPDGRPLDATGMVVHGEDGRPAPALAFGSERHGLSDQLLAIADVRAALSMRDGVSSLNLATAVAATLYVLGAPFPGPHERG